jgi:Zn-finger nucleic acid-binding protein
MRTYERNGVLIDQCEECRGIFLDRGELEQLLDADRGHDQRGERDEDRYDDHYRAHGHDHDHGHDRHDDHHHDDDDDTRRRGRRRTSPAQFLSDFLGGGGE